MIEIRGSHILVALGVVALGYVLNSLAYIMLPFVLGFALAYFLDPVADWLEAIGLRRSLATATITFFGGLILLAGLAFGLPTMIEQITLLLTTLPSYISEMQTWLLAKNVDGNQSDIINSVSESMVSGIQQSATALLTTGLSIINLLSLLVITPIVAIYMLNDWDRMVAHINDLLPDEQAPTIRKLALQIDETLGGFARGQLMVCMSLGTMYAVGLSLIGLESAIFVGFLAGLVSFVPYVGAAFGMLLAGALGLGQFGFDWFALAQIAAVFFVGQFIEGNILTPRLVGDRVHLHPVWIIFALLAMGSLFGFLGLLLAVPIAAVIGVLVRHMLIVYARDYQHVVDGENGHKD